MANYICIDSVEEQVNYLTDKIKDLKNSKLDKTDVVQETGTGTDVVMSQKAVTEQLNTKITAPTTPTADSAVTMLADGTVVTKPLSDISGNLSILTQEQVDLLF